MVFGLDLATTEQPVLTAPEVTITFGGAGGGGGGLLGDIAAAAGLSAAGPGLEDGLVRMRLHRAVAPDVDWVELLLAPVPGGPDLPAPGDSGRIEVAAGAGRSAFACTVDLVERRTDGTLRLTATNGGRVLARTRQEASFAGRTPGEIIDALCAGQAVDSAAGAAGEALPRHVVDEGRSLQDHVAQLAATAGRLALFDDAGRLVLVDDTAGGDAVAVLAAGATLLDARTGQREAGGRITIDGAGAGDRGGNAWAWLRKKAGPQRASAGTAPPETRRAAPWVRAPDAAAALAGAQARALERMASAGRFVAAAVPAIVPGALFSVTGTARDGDWRALAVDMTFDTRNGLLSDIRAAPLPEGGGLAGLLEGLP